MNWSYWEIKSWLTNIDFTIIGSGIVGLTCALALKERFPKANILIIERGILPQGASTKNAGFACFGSLSEILSDLNSNTETATYNLVENRLKGLETLQSIVSNKTMQYKQNGGYELFLKTKPVTFETCVNKINSINTLLKPLFKKDVFQLINNPFKFQNIFPQTIFNPFEGQIDTGKMMMALLKKNYTNNIKILNGVEVLDFLEHPNHIHVKTPLFEFKTRKLFIATNGFASQLISEKVVPARAQVLITEPIKNLHIKGTFHLDEGFYYFRNINNRILFGGGRNIDFKGEQTAVFGQTIPIQNALELFLKQVILPDTTFKIEHRWSGIMGFGTNKTPVIKPVGNNVFCGVQLGGMGIAIGALVGKKLAQFA